MFALTKEVSLQENKDYFIKSGLVTFRVPPPRGVPLRVDVPNQLVEEQVMANCTIKATVCLYKPHHLFFMWKMHKPVDPDAIEQTEDYYV
jgi:hypothetical protein